MVYSPYQMAPQEITFPSFDLWSFPLHLEVFLLTPVDHTKH